MTDRIIDVSSNNHKFASGQWDSLDFSDPSFDGVYIKVGQGSNYHGQMYFNPCLLLDYNAAKSAGKKVGFYWFYDMGWNVQVQVNAFVKAIVNLEADYYPVFDYELGVPSQSILDSWNALLPQSISYMDRYFWQLLQPQSTLWVAVPGWSEGDPNSWNAAMIQYGQVDIPGLPNGPTDISIVLDKGKIEMPIPPYNSASGIQVSPPAAVDITPVTPPAENPPVVGSADPTDAPLVGATGVELVSPYVDGASVPGVSGAYYLVSADGTVSCFGGAVDYGSITTSLNRPICAIMVEDASGYALVAEDGGVFTFGDFQYKGSV